MNLEYHVVDVFTRRPLEGNALAVFTDAARLSDEAMQKIARELNLSETTFVLPPTDATCDVRVRIFTPTYEMHFAGHPTIGTAYVIREAGIVPHGTLEMVLEERVGPVKVRVDSGEAPIIWLESPAIANIRAYDRAACAQALGLTEDDLIPGVPCELMTAGNPNIFVALRDKRTVDRAVLDPVKFATLHADQAGPMCLFIFSPVADGAYSRMFAPDLGVPEDPATGSATGPLASFMMIHALVSHADGTRFVSEQGTKMGRRSLLHVHVEGNFGSRAIHIGGHVTPIARATMVLEGA